MANADNPTGFLYSSIHQPHPPVHKVYEKQVGLAQAIYQGDVVHAIAGVATFHKPPIEPFITGTPGTTIPLGVANHWSQASKRARVSICVDLRAEFVAQDDGATDGINAVDLGKNANVATQAGNDLTKFSKYEIGEASIGTSSALDLHIIEFWEDPIFNAFGLNCRVLVTFNKARFATQTAGV